MKTLVTPLIALAMALPLAACGERPQTNDPAADTTLGQKVREATDVARKQLAEGIISVSKHSGAKFEIAPDGSLLITDAAEPLDASQRALALR